MVSMKKISGKNKFFLVFIWNFQHKAGRNFRCKHKKTWLKKVAEWCKLPKTEVLISVLKLGVAPFNMWLILNWEEHNCCYKLSNWQNDNYFNSKWQLEWNRFGAFAHLVTTVFSAVDKSRVRWDNSQNTIQKISTQELNVLWRASLPPLLTQA